MSFHLLFCGVIPREGHLSPVESPGMSRAPHCVLFNLRIRTSSRFRGPGRGGSCGTRGPVP